MSVSGVLVWLVGSFVDVYCSNFPLDLNCYRYRTRPLMTHKIQNLPETTTKTCSCATVGG